MFWVQPIVENPRHKATEDAWSMVSAVTEEDAVNIASYHYWLPTDEIRIKPVNADQMMLALCSEMLPGTDEYLDDRGYQPYSSLAAYDACLRDYPRNLIAWDRLRLERWNEGGEYMTYNPPKPKPAHSLGYR